MACKCLVIPNELQGHAIILVHIVSVYITCRLSVLWMGSYMVNTFDLLYDATGSWDIDHLNAMCLYVVVVGVGLVPLSVSGYHILDLIYEKNDVCVCVSVSVCVCVSFIAV